MDAWAFGARGVDDLLIDVTVRSEMAQRRAAPPTMAQAWRTWVERQEADYPHALGPECTPFVVGV